ncbi:MAG: YlzJ-like family protein [Oscillospiraceae bacterium]|nr:YlzJ-like family protein [Oscillospiraceae bacterium]
MIYSVVPTDVVFFDNTQIRQRQIKMYDNVTLELVDGIVDRIISTNPHDYMKYSNLLGSDKIPM